MTTKNLISKDVIINDRKYSYYDSKIGAKTIIGLHGLNESKDVIAAVTKRDDRFRYIFVDLPGHNGISMENITDLNDYANYVIELINHLKIENYGLLGFSLGGIVALKILELVEPKRRVPSVIWASPLNYEHPFISLYGRSVLKLLSSLPTSIYQNICNSGIMDLYMKEREKRLDIVEKRNLDQYDNHMIQKIPDTFISHSPANLSSPLLYIFSPEDRFIESKYLSEIPLNNQNQQVEIIDGGGHNGTKEGYTEVNKKFHKFFLKYL